MVLVSEPLGSQILNLRYAGDQVPTLFNKHMRRSALPTTEDVLRVFGNELRDDPERILMGLRWCSF